MLEFITTDKNIDTIASVAQIKRADATNALAYNHELDRIPYLYGVYGDSEGKEQQGLIKGSTGVVINELAEEYDGEIAESIKNGIIPEELRHKITDIHNVAIKDGNASIPVGLIGKGHKEINKETGEFEGDEAEVLWYGAAVPVGLLWEVHNRSLAFTNYKAEEAKKYADSLAGGAATVLPFVADNSRYAVYQDSEKNDEAVTLSFSEVPDSTIKAQFAKTYNRLTDTGVNALSLGSSIAMGKRSFAAGSSNIAATEKAIATGCDCIAAGKQSFTAGYANIANADSSATLGAQNYTGGSAAIATGLQTKAIGDYSFTTGNNTIAASANQFVCGKFNDNKVNTVFEVGYGADNNNRSNVFEVYANGDVNFGNIKFTQQDFAALKEILSNIQ